MIRADLKVFDIYPHYTCNARCIFCFNPADVPAEEKKGFSFKEVAESLYKMYQTGHRYLNILGGEPTVRDDLVEICALSKKIGYKGISITTNGIKLADPRLVKRLAMAGLDMALLSIHGHNAELHDRVSGVPGSFEKCLKGIRHLQKADVGIQLAFVAGKLNHSCLDDFFRYFVLNFGISHYTVLYLRYHGHVDIPDGRFADLKVSMSEVARSVKKAFRFFLDRGLRPPRLCHFLPCVLPGYQLRMDNLVMPEDEPFSGIYLDPETEGVSEYIDHKDKLKLPRCKKCVFFDFCPGVEETYLKNFGDSEVVPVLKAPLPFSGRRAVPASRAVLHRRRRA